MTIIKWGHQPRFSDVFDTMFNKENEFTGEHNCGCIPRTNIIEKNESFVLEFAVPGMKKNDFKINLDNKLLVVSADLEEKSKDKEANFTRKEYEVGSFKRTFIMPKTVDADKIKADYKNGILRVELPKKEEVKVSKEIQIA
jgi:HSP20 family protein